MGHSDSEITWCHCDGKCDAKSPIHLIIALARPSVMGVSGRLFPTLQRRPSEVSWPSTNHHQRWTAIEKYWQELTSIYFDYGRVKIRPRMGWLAIPVGSIGRSGSPLHQNIPNLWWWQWWLKHVKNMESWWKLWKTHGKRRRNKYFCPANVPWIHWWPRLGTNLPGVVPPHSAEKSLTKGCCLQRKWLS